MTPMQYREALGKLGLTIVGAGPYFGLAPRQCQRLASGESPVPELVEKVIILLLSGRICLADLETSPRAPRLKKERG
jgi:hypothetical protein